MGQKRALKKVVNPLFAQIERMLQRSHRPLVTTKESSTIFGAGRGVFTTHRVFKGEVLCLYPGVYSAGLPVGTEVGPFLYDPVAFIGHVFPPSGRRMQHDNSYILPFDDPPSGIVEKESGYIDGLALEVKVLRGSYKDSDEGSNTSSSEELETRRLDENPNACGHLVNHSHRAANVRVVPFAWDEVLPNFVQNKNTFDLPNIARKDGAPRYIHQHCAETIYYEQGEPTFGTVGVCGAAVCAEVNLEADNELLRDYNLDVPLPDWAVDWYVVPPSDSDNEQDDTDDDESDDKWRLIP